MSADLLRIENVSKRFGAVQALSEVSFCVSQQEIVGFAGENGAGKSTLIKILAGIHTADQGAVFLNKKPYAPKDPSAAGRPVWRFFTRRFRFVRISQSRRTFFSERKCRRDTSCRIGVSWRLVVSICIAFS